jgi:hypothetical protein
VNFHTTSALDRIAELEETVLQLRAVINRGTNMRFPAEWKLPPQLTKLAQALAKAPNGYRTREQLIYAISKPNDIPSTDSSLASGLARLRAKTGITVRCDYIGGCHITPESQKFLLEHAIT